MANHPVTNFRWRWLHRIGFLCTLLVAIEIVWAGAFIGSAWWRDRERDAEARAHSRVHRGELLTDLTAIDPGSGAISRLGVLAPMAMLGPDAVRLGVHPALSDYAYALAMRRRGAVAEGLVVVFERRADYTEERKTYRFQVPVAEFNQVMSQFDAVTDGYAGGDRLCTDGTKYAFERRRGSLTTSGTSVSSCDRTYERAANILIEFARRFSPLPKLLR
ncbi:hypothetical protein [uncultured Sphingomonas sp.]|uniref:hypothetical protein n=1 Tax=uncultured Sphingomonas sp. TaxID=158754 RepID=UPI0025D5621A|nr:hypothetical protein [uncultured Sphingomonas sp.]